MHMFLIDLHRMGSASRPQEMVVVVGEEPMPSHGWMHVLAQIALFRWLPSQPRHPPFWTLQLPLNVASMAQ
jgi:hypothetical protein